MAEDIKKYAVFEIVRKYIDELNPYGLLPDAPADEFDSESEEIAHRIYPDMSVEQIAVVIAGVLNRSFAENVSPDRYREISAFILQEIRRLS